MNAAPANEAEFLRLIEVNRPRILRICRVYAWNPQDAEDLYQEILFQIWRGWPGIKEKVHANTWLYRVALNTAISFVRKHQAKRHVIPTELGELREEMDRRQAVVAGEEGNAQVDRLYEALAQLGKVERGLVALYLDDLSYEEIAEVMGLNANQVGVMLHRTKKRLSELLKEMAV